MAYLSALPTLPQMDFVAVTAGHEKGENETQMPILRD